MNQILLLSIILVFFRAKVILAADCPEDFSPCTCTLDAPGEMIVTCDRIAIPDVQSVFNQSESTNIHRLWWKLTSDDGVIPAGLISNKLINEFYIYCPSESFSLKIDPEAFRDTSSHTKLFRISGCDLGQLDYGFLNNFESVTELFVPSSMNVHTIESLPLLPNLEKLSITNCEGLDEIHHFPNLSSVFKSLYLSGNHLTDAGAKVILDSIISTPAVSSIELVTMADNKLTSIPSGLSLFPKLKEIYFSSGNTISILTKGSLALPVNEKQIKLQLKDVGLTSIEEGALEGNYSLIYLSNNKLNKFEQAIFQPILEEMARNKLKDSLYLDANPIECDCHLQWLVRDNRDLMRVIYGGTCSDSTPFEILNPDEIDCTNSASKHFNNVNLMTALILTIFLVIQ